MTQNQGYNYKINAVEEWKLYKKKFYVKFNKFNFINIQVVFSIFENNKNDSEANFFKQIKSENWKNKFKIKILIF